MSGELYSSRRPEDFRIRICTLWGHFGCQSGSPISVLWLEIPKPAREQPRCLAIALSRLRPGGRAVLADEVEPDSAARRVLHRAGRLPLAVVTYLLTQTTTRAVDGLGDQLRASGFVDVDEERPWPAFAIVSGSRPLEAA